MHNLLTVNLVYTDGTSIDSDAPIHIYARLIGNDGEIKLATDANRQCIVPVNSRILRATTTLPDGRQINATAPGDGIQFSGGEARTLKITVGPLNATLSIGQNDIPGWEEKTGTVNP